MSEPNQTKPPVGLFDIGQFALSASEGMQLLGHVTATYAYRSIPAEGGATSSELKNWAKVEQKAYETVLTRLREQAQALGAAGVIGAQLVRQPRKWDTEFVEITAQGTAISVPQMPPSAASFVCALSAAEFVLLRQAGYLPAGAVVGVCAYHQVTHLRVERELLTGKKEKRITPNIERSDFTRGYYTARAGAMHRLEEAAQSLGTVGVIGVRLETTRRRHDDHSFGTTHVGRMTIECVAQGTAIHLIPPSKAYPIKYVVPVNV